jgi:hypothetical protein
MDWQSPRSGARAGGLLRGAQCVLKVPGYLVEDGDVDELQRVMRRDGRTIRVLLQGVAPRQRRH